MVMVSNQIEPGWFDINTLEWAVHRDGVLDKIHSLNALKEVSKAVGNLSFQGLLVVNTKPEINLEQDFLVAYDGDNITIKNQPKNSHPVFLIELTGDLLAEQFGLKRNFVGPSDNSVDAGIWWTRLLFSLDQADKFSIKSLNNIDLVSGRFPALTKSEKVSLLHSARVYRKLKYIEDYFDVKFALRDRILHDEVRLIDMVFRAVTESKFLLRESKCVFYQVPSTEIDIKVPPFDSPGKFSRIVGPDITLFGQKLNVGDITVSLEKAVLADPKVIRHIQEGKNKSLDIRFEILDNQITYCFERYSKQSKKQRMSKLELYKKSLIREEPKELVDLIDKALQKDVSAEEALQIAAGWQQYNDLPDRYCPQEPEFDAKMNAWRVPIYLVYTGINGDKVGELFIDYKTGKIVSHTPIKEMRSKGLSIAKKMLNAR